MKINKKFFITGILFASIVSGIMFKRVFAQQNAGTINDPIVTKNYVDSRISEILTIISENNKLATPNAISEQSLSNEEIEKIVVDVISKLPNTNNNQTQNTSEKEIYVPVELKTGQILLGKEGAEIVLRSGKAIIETKVANGVLDVTAGKDLNLGTQANINHLLIIPRGDGRGLISLTNCWFLVKGGYEIK